MEVPASTKMQILDDGARPRGARAAFSGGAVRISMMRSIRRRSGGGAGV